MTAPAAEAAPRFAAIITAAGASTRMGRPKALVPWDGVPLLLHQARVLGGHPDLGPIVAVVGADAEPIRRAAAAWAAQADPPARLHLVDNPRWEAGRSTSLEVAAATLATSAVTGLAGVFVMAVDQPLSPAVIAALVAAFGPDDEVLAPAHAGRRGHPIVLAGHLLARLARASEWHEGLRGIVRAARVRELEVGDATIHLDLNTPDALARAGGA